MLVTMHYPLEMGCVAAVLQAVAKAYPQAVVGENGQVWSSPVSPPGHINRDGGVR